MEVSNCCGALPIGETHNDLGFCSKCRDHAVFVDEEENNDILVTVEWYQYYRECARKLRLILRIIDHTGIVRDDDTMNTIIGEAHRDMRKLADVLDPEEKKEWLSRFQKVDKYVPNKKQTSNKRRRELHSWLKRAEAVNIDPLPSQRPIAGQRKEWEESIMKAERVQHRNKSFDIGAYKRECINKLKNIAVGKTLLIEDRTYQTVEWWIIGMENSMEEFKGKKFHVEGVNHNTQLIRRIK